MCVSVGVPVCLIHTPAHLFLVCIILVCLLVFNRNALYVEPSV